MPHHPNLPIVFLQVTCSFVFLTKNNEEATKQERLWITQSRILRSHTKAESKCSNLFLYLALTRHVTFNRARLPDWRIGGDVVHPWNDKTALAGIGVSLGCETWTYPAGFQIPKCHNCLLLPSWELRERSVPIPTSLSKISHLIPKDVNIDVTNLADCIALLFV